MKNKIFKFFNVVFVFILLILTGCYLFIEDIHTVVKSVHYGTGIYENKTVIIHTNDVHGYIDGYVNVLSYKNYIESEGGNVLLIDAGDFSEGNLNANIYKGSNIIELMNLCGYDCVTVGNHDFSYGIDILKENISNGTFYTICSNVYENGEAMFEEEIIFKIKDLTIGFFALLSPETKTKVMPSIVENLEITQYSELYSDAQESIDKLSDCDLTICISHLGYAVESTGNISSDIFNNTTGLDFIIDGHSHSIMEQGDSGEPIQSAGSYLEDIGVIIIDNNTKEIENNYLVNTSEIDEFGDNLEPLKEIIEESHNNVDLYYKNKIGESLVYLDGVKQNVRSKETNLADLFTDAMVWQVLSTQTLNVPIEDTIAITNGGGIRISINIGDITFEDINNVLPFSNTLSVIYVKGYELLEVLEASTFCSPNIIGGFPQIANMVIEIDTSKEYDAGDLYPNSTYHKPNSINRVTILSINDQPFDENKTYAVITNNFCADGGDTYYAFKRAKLEGNFFDTSILLDECLKNYIVEYLGGIIGLEYQDSQNRIIYK